MQRYVRDRAARLGPEEWVTTAELAAELYDEVTASRTAGLTRVINLLADRGEVVTDYIVRGGTVHLAIRGPG